MNFINKKNGFRLFLQLSQQCLEAFFKIPTVLGASQQCTHIQRIDHMPLEDIRHLVFDHHTGQTFNYCRFTDTGFAHQQWIVLASSTQYLNQAQYFFVAANQRINATLPGQLIEVGGIVFQCTGGTAALFFSAFLL